MASATRSLPILSLQAAEAAALASQQKAKELGIDVNIAIVDNTLHLLHFTRMPTAKLTSISIAINKAFTAAGHRLPTSHYNSPTFSPGGMGWGIQYSNQGRFCTLTGGVPIFVDGEVVGAIGVSSGSAGEDVQVAEAGIRAVEVMGGRTRGAKL